MFVHCTQNINYPKSKSSLNYSLRFLCILIIAFIAASCSESKMVQTNFVSYQAPIGYLHDSSTNDCPKTDSLKVNLGKIPLDEVTDVSVIDKVVFPSIALNIIDENMLVTLGQNSIQQMYGEFFMRSLVDESKRIGCFGVCGSLSGKSGYTLDVKIDTCRTISKYQQHTTIVFVYFYKKTVKGTGFPAETTLTVSVKLRKGRRVVFEKSYAVKRTQPFVNSPNVAAEKLKADLVANMVQSLSLSTKQCIEEIISDVNSTMQGN